MHMQKEKHSLWQFNIYQRSCIVDFAKQKIEKRHSLKAQQKEKHAILRCQEGEMKTKKTATYRFFLSVLP